MRKKKKNKCNLNNEHGTRFKINMSKTIIRLPTLCFFYFRSIVVTVKQSFRNIPNEFALNNTTTALYNYVFNVRDQIIFNA